MDRIINEMHEAGIKVFLGTPAYSIPAYTLHQQGQTDMAVQALIADLEADEVTATRLAAFQLSRIGSPARQAVRALQELMQGHSYQQQASESCINAIQTRIYN